jgi:hypothetical protein
MTRQFPLSRALALVLCAAAMLSTLLFCVVMTPAPALALPEGRSYQLVSPPYKGGYGVASIQAVAPDGESVAFRSRGTFAGTPRDELEGFYLTSRGESGWSTSPLEPPAVLAPSGDHADISSTLGAVLFKGCVAPNQGAGSQECSEYVLREHSTDTPDTEASSWPAVGEPLKLLEQTGKSFDIGYEGASPDLCHVLFTPAGEGAMVAAAKGTKAELYDDQTGCDGEPPALRLVGVNNREKVINPECQERLGGWGNETQGPQFNAVAAGGREIFFTQFVEPADGATHCGGNIPPSSANPSQLFVRLGGSRTVEVSRPVEASKSFGGCKKGGVAGEVPCEGASKRAPALFWGASEDGSRVYFTTPAPLTNEKDETDNLYVASIGCPEGEPECEVAGRQVTSLVRVSKPAGALLAGEAAEVQGVVKVAPDGSHVYFVARGVLSEAAGPEGRLPVKGADNLYVYDNLTGGTAFIADLCSGPNASGSAVDARCPGESDGSLWHQLNEGDEAQVNVCGRPSADECVGERETGRFLVFASYRQLLRGDTDNAKDVYRYDTQTGALDRVSAGEGGSDSNGNCNDAAGASTCDARIVPNAAEQAGAVYAQQELLDRAISEDGSRVVFTTAAPLSSSATNDLVNVYEWHKEPAWSEGSVAILSTGSSTTSDVQPVITPSGEDVFFLTSQGLVPQDTDGQQDVYDATLRGGFPPVAAAPQPCSGDACYGPLTNPAPLLVPGSVSQAPGQNFTAPASAPVVKAKPKPKKVKKKKKKRKLEKRGGAGAKRSAKRSAR